MQTPLLSSKNVSNKREIVGVNLEKVILCYVCNENNSIFILNNSNTICHKCFKHKYPKNNIGRECSVQ